MPVNIRAKSNGSYLVGSIAGAPARVLVPIIYGLTVFAFVVDMVHANTLAYGIVYAPMVATAVFYKSRSALWILAGIATLLIVLGIFLPAIDPDLFDLIGNRILSLAAIAATALFVNHARATQERLAEQTRRAQAGERVKAEVLANMGHEMRTPLHGLLGVTSLMMADCRPDQRESLGRVRQGARQLLDSIDNLMDLTQLDERPIAAIELDLAAAVQAAAASAAPVAREGQVTLSLPQAGAAPLIAVGDAWAVRRILDNLLANAIQAATAGGRVSIAIGRRDRWVTVDISDPGRGLPPEMARYLADTVSGNAAPPPEAAGTGLTLSERLARGMAGRLVALDQVGDGTTMRLSLPAKEAV